MNLSLTAENYKRIAMGALTRKVPVYAHFGITHRCNLTCKMCGIWRYGNKKEELSLDEIREVAAECDGWVLFNVRSVVVNLSPMSR